jgi:hypothetical protein
LFHEGPLGNGNTDISAVIKNKRGRERLDQCKTSLPRMAMPIIAPWLLSVSRGNFSGQR